MHSVRVRGEREREREREREKERKREREVGCLPWLFVIAAAKKDRHSLSLGQSPSDLSLLLLFFPPTLVTLTPFI